MITHSRIRVGATAVAFWWLSASSAQTPPAPETDSSTRSYLAVPATPVLPDLGKLEAVPIRAEGHGRTAAEAVDEAIRSAILQANGTSMDLHSAQLQAAVTLAAGQDELSLRSNAFAQAVSQRSRGALTNFRIESLRKVDSGSEYTATIAANVAKFVQPASAHRVRVVVAPIRFNSATYEVGDDAVPAHQIAAQLRQQIINELAQTERFTVLDRDVTTELSDELNLISSGDASVSEFAKLGHALSADVIWIAQIESFGYHKHARKLQTSDRQLVSYTGGATFSHRLVNVATRQIVFSESVNYDLPLMGSTTLGRRPDTRQTLMQLSNGLTAKVVPEIVMRMFPITVLSRNGDSVILSQGGTLVHENASYELVQMGEELTDPQTGESLGKAERPRCRVHIDRVTPRLSYGTLEERVTGLGTTAAGSLQLRQLVSPKATATRPVSTAAQSMPSPARVAPHAGSIPPKPSEDKSW